jgi:hypothetical protein
MTNEILTVRFPQAMVRPLLLNELVLPAQKFAAAGYDLVFANPRGNAPAVDQASVSVDCFGGSQDELESVVGGGIRSFGIIIDVEGYQ